MVARSKRGAFAAVAVATAALVACGSKPAPDGAGSNGSASAASPPSPPAVRCPPGQVSKDGACVVVMTPEKIAAVAGQQSRLDDLAKLLDQADAVAAPIELFDNIRQLEPWKKLRASSENIAAVDAVAATLDNAVKTLGTLKGRLGEVSTRLGSLKYELDQLMIGTGEPRTLDDVRRNISPQLRAVVVPFAQDVDQTIRRAVVPLATRLSDLSDVVITGCTMAKASRTRDKLKDLCTQARAGLPKALAYADQLKTEPARLFTEMTSQLEAQLDQLVDDETKEVVEAVQRKVNDSLKPAQPTGAAPGSGSAADTEPTH